MFIKINDVPFLPAFLPADVVDDAVFNDATVGASSDTITSEDRPIVSIPTVVQNQTLTDLDAKYTFDLRVVALTDDNRNGADKVLTGHAKATWGWDASGTFAGNAGALTYKHTGSITAPTAWQAVNGLPPYDATNPSAPFFNSLIEPADNIWVER